MWPVMRYLSYRACSADALFVSALQRSDEPDAEQVRRAVAAAVSAFGAPGCTELVAQEFGDHPETAVIRMRWACMAVREAFGDPGSEPVPALDTPPGSGRHAAPARCMAGAE